MCKRGNRNFCPYSLMFSQRLTDIDDEELRLPIQWEPMKQDLQEIQEVLFVQFIFVNNIKLFLYRDYALLILLTPTKEKRLQPISPHS